MESNFQPQTLLFFFGLSIVIMIVLALLVVAYSSQAQRRLWAQKMQTQQIQLEHQQELLERNLLVQEEERQRIAAQLHDDIGSKLGVLHLAFHRLRRTETDSEPYAPLCEEIEELIGNTLKTTRRISHELLPPTLEDFGLIEALREFSESILRTGAVDFRLVCDLTRADLPDASVELNLFRIVQELTNNSLKYGQATEITVQLCRETDRLALHYRENGQGFDAEHMQSRGLGLKNIENRVRIIKGTWVLHSAPGQGVQVQVWWPPDKPYKL
jgi:signal transduction histidine kinase